MFTASAQVVPLDDSAFDGLQSDIGTAVAYEISAGKSFTTVHHIPTR
jgi:hypothetical protein